jgi:pyruvate kinase
VPKQRITDLILALDELREHMLQQAAGRECDIGAVDPAYRAGARNLAHYLGLRQRDIRPLQDALSELGLSSLGRCESHALASVEAVLRAATALLGRSAAPDGEGYPQTVSASDSVADLAEHTRALLGPEPDGRKVRIMVTLPPEAADYSLVRGLIESGMNCARINCAHDDAEIWQKMAHHVRRASEELQSPCSIVADLAGPKFRILGVPISPAVVHTGPRRDARGTVLDPAHVWLTWREDVAQGEPDAVLRAPRRWLTQLRSGDRLKLEDLRGKRRSLTVTEVSSEGCWVDGLESAYVGHDLRLRIARRASGTRAACPECEAQPCGMDTPSQVVHRGDRLILTPPDAPAQAGNGTSALPRIPCSLPASSVGICPGVPIWFDDGKVGGRVRRVENGEVEVEITLTKQGGARLRSDRSINLPESVVQRQPLLPKDLRDLDFVTNCADMVGLSFAESAEVSSSSRKRFGSVRAAGLAWC